MDQTASVAQPHIRLLACDMDGTLFRSDLKISQRVREAIREAQRVGVTIVLATGRMPAAAKPFVELLGLNGPQIYYNGALVQTTEGETLFHIPIDPPVAQQVVRYTRATRMHLNAYVGDTIYVERLSPTGRPLHTCYSNASERLRRRYDLRRKTFPRGRIYPKS